MSNKVYKDMSEEGCQQGPGATHLLQHHRRHRRHHFELNRHDYEQDVALLPAMHLGPPMLCPAACGSLQKEAHVHAAVKCLEQQLGFRQHCNLCEHRRGLSAPV